jgi:amino acid transporter
MTDMKKSTSSQGIEPLHEVKGLDRGHLSRPKLVALALTAMTPGMGMVLVPVLVFTYSGMASWTSLLIAMVAAMCIGATVTTFARRYVVTGSLYSYVSHALGGWARCITGGWVPVSSPASMR